MATERKTTLRLHNDKSDKTYKISLTKSGEGYIVNFEYGKTGGNLKPGTKTRDPVDIEQATKLYENVLARKLVDGYSVESGSSIVTTNTIGQHILDKDESGFKCQLLTEIEPDDMETVEKFLADPAWGLQQKADGKRFTVQKASKGINGINRQGNIKPVTPYITAQFRPVDISVLVDGELIHEPDRYYLFDMLKHERTDLKKLSFHERYVHLTDFCAKYNLLPDLIPLYITEKEKRAAFKRFQDTLCEGVVFKRLDAPFSSGRPNSGGDQRKYKFYKTASFVVSQINQKRSVGLFLVNRENTSVNVGNVTIPPNFDIPRLGTIVEVRYLYAYPDTHCIYQPVYLGERDDIPLADCKLTQLKYKKG